MEGDLNALWCCSGPRRSGNSRGSGPSSRTGVGERNYYRGGTSSVDQQRSFLRNHKWPRIGSRQSWIRFRRTIEERCPAIRCSRNMVTQRCLAALHGGGKFSLSPLFNLSYEPKPNSSQIQEARQTVILGSDRRYGLPLVRRHCNVRCWSQKDG